MEKYAQDLERYGYIVDYFKKNKDRINTNRNYLACIDNELYNNIKEGVTTGDKSRELYNKLHPLLIENLRAKLESIESLRKRKNLVDQWIGESI